MGLDFSLVDVLTDRPFGGNRLAVFPSATGISALEGTARKEDGRIAEVVVSGFATIVGHGTMILPSAYGDGAASAVTRAGR